MNIMHIGMRLPSKVRCICEVLELTTRAKSPMLRCKMSDSPLANCERLLLFCNGCGSMSNRDGLLLTLLASSA